MSTTPYLCPHCQKPIPEDEILRAASAIMGARTSRKKRAAVRQNGKKGGRPKGAKDSKPRVRRSQEEIEDEGAEL